MTKTEKILLAIAAVFFLLALAFVPRGGTVRQVESAYEQPLRATPGPTPGELWVAVTRRVDLNHADAAALTVLPGVGKTTAEAIVAYREEHGPFASVEEPVLVPGVGEATLEAILAADGEN